MGAGIVVQSDFSLIYGIYGKVISRTVFDDSPGSEILGGGIGETGTFAVIFIVQKTENVESVFPVIEICLLEKVGVMFVPEGGTVVQRETLTDRCYCLNPDYGIDRRGVSCTRSCHHIHALDSGRCQLVEFRGVAYLASVDVYERFTSPEDFDVITAS